VTATSSSSGHVEEYENEEKGVLPTLWLVFSGCLPADDPTGILW
jgi:hypothetical protein